MKFPSKFCVRVVVFILIFLFINIAFIFIYSFSKQNNYLAATNEKHALLSSIQESKIVIIGGSNVAFGIDSQILEENLGYRVVNMGLQGGLGCIYPLEEVKRDLRSGDIVVLMPEYLCISDVPNLYGDAVLYQLLVTAPQNLKYVTQSGQIKVILKEFQNQYPNIFLQVRENYEDILYPESESIYSRTGFNQYGDVFTHLDKTSLLLTPDTFRITCAEEGCLIMIDVYNQFSAELQDRGVRVYYTFPPYLIQVEKDTEQIAEHYRQYLDDHMNILILGKPQDFFYSPEYFFDTTYHLTRTGRDMRTRQLLSSLQDVID